MALDGRLNRVGRLIPIRGSLGSDSFSKSPCQGPTLVRQGEMRQGEMQQGGRDKAAVREGGETLRRSRSGDLQAETWGMMMKLGS